STSTAATTAQRIRFMSFHPPVARSRSPRPGAFPPRATRRGYGRTGAIRRRSSLSMGVSPTRRRFELSPAEASRTALAPAAPRAKPEIGVRGGPAAARAAVGEVVVGPHALHLALAQRAVAHERAQLTAAAAPAAHAHRLRVVGRAPAVALEPAGITPRARLP